MATLWALPGFLGLPQDWDLFAWQNLVGVDPLSFEMNGLPGWAKQFNDWIEQQEQTSNLLMGYSLGGRLALHALIDRPSLWQAAIIVSAHPGLTDPMAKEERQQLDAQWARRFRTDPWTNVMGAWDGCEVFAGESFRFDRQECAYERKKLACLLTEGSLGRQENLRPEIARLQLPILWIAGEEDPRFCRVAETVSLSHPVSRKMVIPQAGHRVPWSQPERFAKEVESFLQDISLEEKW
jgi:2-succinyl-6-hydroxy-2,4-cyclohexadiene-1-carboxylate synthase